jgi:transcriptional regulator with XRE-family HTH domain
LATETRSALRLNAAMSDRDSTARSRELGVELRRLRERTGCTATEFAQVVGWSNSKVSRIETGLRGITEVDVVRYAAYCRAAPGEVDDLVRRCREAEVPGFWVSGRLSTLIFHETAAASSISYDSLVVPGLLQTERYVRAHASRGPRDARDVEYLIEARMTRQEVLGRRRFTFFVHEQALRFPVGDGRLMNEQMLKILLLAEHPWLSIRVVPLAAGVGGALGGEFVLFRFEGARPLLHLGQREVSLFLEDAALIAAYREHVAAIADVALDRGQSREVLAALAAEFDVSEDSHGAQVAEE